MRNSIRIREKVEAEAKGNLSVLILANYFSVVEHCRGGN